MKNKIPKYIFILSLGLISSCHLLAQDKQNNLEWKPLNDSLITYYQLKDESKVDYYAEELFKSERFQIHDSLKVLVGAITSHLKTNETEAFRYLNLTQTQLLQSGDNKNLLGWNYYYKANWYYQNSYDKKALNYYYKADSVFTAINRISFMSAMTLAGICDVLMQSGLNEPPVIIDQIFPYIEKGLRVSDSIQHFVPKSIFLYKKGVLFFALEDLEQAENFFNESLEISFEHNNYTRTALIYDRLAKIALKRNLLDAAISYQEAAVSKAKDISDLIVVAQVNLELGILYNKTKNFNGAIQHLNYAAEVLNQSRSSRKQTYHDIEYNLAEAHFGKGAYREGYTYLKAAKKIIQEAQQIRNTERIEEVEAKYQTEKKEQEIILLKAQNQLMAQQKINERYALLGSIAITSFGGLFFFFLYRTRQKNTQRLQELDRAKSTFFTNISHEFRTPLTMISGPLQSQLRKSNLNEADRSAFKMMYRNATRLLSLVDQLLDISKIEVGHLKLSVAKNDTIPFIGMLVDGFSFKASQKQIDYKIFNKPSEIDTYFDADVLEKIIVNLVSNAIKYTPEKGSIVCDAFIQKDSLYFSVKNTGRSLSKKETKGIFNRFYQLNENAPGAGIGLALVEELVVLHKGLIEVESIPNEWTTFKVIIPISKNSFTEKEFVSQKKHLELEQETNASQAILNTGTTKGLAKKEEAPILLIVDDSPDIRTYISTLFRNVYTVLEATNGQEGIDMAIEQVPDIIISDIMMPVKNGIQLCNQLKSDEHTSHIPIVLLTAKAGEENEIEGIKTGADDYITKPFNEKILRLRVDQLVESRKRLQLRYSQKIVLKPKDIAISSVDEQFLERLQNILDQELTASSFNTQTFSEAIGMSRMQLHRKLKALTGLSASEFISSERLKLAAQLLKTSRINVSEACYQVGFKDHAYFSKCFKDKYNCSPTAYIRASQEEV